MIAACLAISFSTGVALLAESAGAMISSSTTTTSEALYTGGTIRTDNTPGGHGDYHLKINVEQDPDTNYDQGGLLPLPTQRPRRFAGDFPAGFIANPAAIPYEDRCPIGVFQLQGKLGVPATTRCPESSRIGSAMTATTMESPPQPYGFPLDFTTDNLYYGAYDEPGAGMYTGTTFNVAGMAGPVYLLQTENDAPVEAGSLTWPVPETFEPIAVRTKIKPIMSGPDKGRLRWVTDPIPRALTFTQDGSSSSIRVDKFELIMWGQLPSGNEEVQRPDLCVEANPGFPGDPFWYDFGWVPQYKGLGMKYLHKDCRTGKAFITNPTSPGPWTTQLYAQEYDDNSNADADPTGSGVLDFLRLNDITTTPQPSAAPALTTTANAVFSETRRDESPSLDVTLSNPGYASEDISQRGVDVPKRVSVVLPDAVNVDLQRIAKPCETYEFDVRDCPEESVVGTVSVKTPLLSKGMRGDVVIVRQVPGKGSLPRVGLIMYGDAPFNLLSETRYVGNGTQIETTFDDVPQLGFESMRLHIDGGAGGLFKVDGCRPGGAELADGGPTQFTIDGYTGQRKTVSSQTFTPASCFSAKVTVKKISRCLKRGGTLAVSPRYASRGAVRSASLTVNGRTVTTKKSPYNPRLKLRSLKRGKIYRYRLGVDFKPQNGKRINRVVRTGSFRACR